MSDEEAHLLIRSMVDERILLLARLKAYQDRFEQIRELTERPIGPARAALLLKIHLLAEEALTL